MDWIYIQLLFKQGVLIFNVIVSFFTLINSLRLVSIVPKEISKGGRIFSLVNALIFGNCLDRVSGTFLYFPNLYITITSTFVIAGLWFCSWEFLKQQITKKQ